MRICEVCHEALTGRLDKRFCDIQCKNVYHRHMRSVNASVTARIDQFLHRNRTVCYELFKKTSRKKLFIPKRKLYKMGFKFQYYTGSYVNKEGKRYHYVYDYAWMAFSTQDIMIVRRRKPAKRGS